MGIKLKFEKKCGLSEIIAIFAFGAALLAMHQSDLAREDVKILNKLGFNPQLTLKAQLYKTGPIPAHIIIENRGAVDAIQVQIQFSIFRYLPERKKIGIALTGSDLQWTFERLRPLTPKTIKIDESSFASSLPVMDQMKHHRIVEIRLIYRRESDLKEYKESAFYFVNQEGRWVAENDSSLDPQIYDPIKEAAFTFSKFNMGLDSLDISPDILH